LKNSEADLELLRDDNRVIQCDTKYNLRSHTLSGTLMV